MSYARRISLFSFLLLTAFTLTGCSSEVRNLLLGITITSLVVTVIGALVGIFGRDEAYLAAGVGLVATLIFALLYMAAYR